MKTKPKEAISRWDRSTQNIDDMQAIRDFLADLPDQFEIVEPGKVQVEWPKELTRERLEELADYRIPTSDADARSNALRALAAIAPKKRTRMVNAWKTINGDEVKLFDTDFEPNSSKCAPSWRKVGGPFEIED